MLGLFILKYMVRLPKNSLLFVGIFQPKPMSNVGTKQKPKFVEN
jgi:hypothetical protein